MFRRETVCRLSSFHLAFILVLRIFVACYTYEDVVNPTVPVPPCYPAIPAEEKTQGDLHLARMYKFVCRDRWASVYIHPRFSGGM